MLDERKYRRPLDVLIEKHEHSYRADLPSIMVAKEAEAQHLIGEIATIERELIASVGPSLRPREEELPRSVRKPIARALIKSVMRRSNTSGGRRASSNDGSPIFMRRGVGVSRHRCDACTSVFRGTS